jgi:hypothetical protein
MKNILDSNCKLKIGKIVGKNIFENDLLVRNKRQWVSERCKEFINLRVSFNLLNFPYLK